MRFSNLQSPLPGWWLQPPSRCALTVAAEATTPGARRLKSRGFTLIELLLAMIIVATLVPVLYSAMSAGFRAKTKAEAAVEPPRTAELSMDLLRQDFAGAMPPAGTLSNAFIATNASDDRGRDADDVILFSTADAPQDGNTLTNGEIKQIELTVMTAPNGDHVLVRKVTRDVLGLLSGQVSTPDVEVICRGVGGFNLRYYDGLHWGDTWDSTQSNFLNELPAAVEITLTLDRPNGNTPNSDSSRSFRYVRVIPLTCSYAPFNTSLSTGFTQ